ncbi:site-specific integrase [Thermococcus sp.]|uniref:tyrosine-type recombinase/integrase n=1 Tax=Thermococcus sp. TaxID=35749 RepID=UPI00260FE8D0|nr:site-specific integrase [Thermococcus sp.]
MRRAGVIKLEYQPEELQYLVSSDDIEELLADYASTHDVSEAYMKEFERYVWQFMKFVKIGRLESGSRIKAPSTKEEYVISREVLVEYVKALIKAGYSNSSLTKRLQVVIIVLRRLGVSEVFVDVLREPLRRANTARRIEQEGNTPSLTLEDAREFFRRLEVLFKMMRLKKKQYVKSLAFAILLFSTGRRVSEVVQIKVHDIDFEAHSIRIPASNTKEGKLLKIGSGERIVFMTKEAEYVLKYYIKINSKEIKRQQGYLFMQPGKKSLKDTFLHKIIKKSRDLEDLGANLNFIISDGLHRFELKYFRKLFIQEWERQAERCNLLNERVLTAARKITGHRPLNDVHRTNYAKITEKETWKYYKELYYDLSVLTQEQKRLVGLVEEKVVSKSAMLPKQISMVDMGTKTATSHQVTAIRTQTITPAMVYTALLN